MPTTIGQAAWLSARTFPEKWKHQYGVEWNGDGFELRWKTYSDLPIHNYYINGRYVSGWEYKKIHKFLNRIRLNKIVEYNKERDEKELARVMKEATTKLKALKESGEI